MRAMHQTNIPDQAQRKTGERKQRHVRKRNHGRGCLAHGRRRASSSARHFFLNTGMPFSNVTGIHRWRLSLSSFGFHMSAMKT